VRNKASTYETNVVLVLSIKLLYLRIKILPCLML
jgi:hypothetical protein